MYDIVIIGAGPAGYTAALEATKRGKRTALIEKEAAGGICLNKGCIPTKTYLREAREAAMGMRGRSRKGAAEEIAGVVKILRQGLESSLNQSLIDRYDGTAEIIDRHTVRIKEQQADLEAEYIILAAGSVPERPDIPGAGLKHVFTTDDAFDEENIFPDSIAVIGGGVIGIEFAYLLNSAGTRVCVFEAGPYILPHAGRELSEIVERDLGRQGIQIRKNSCVCRIEEEDDERIITFTESGQKKQAAVQKVLLAVGRRPNIDAAGMGRIGLQTENGRIKVNKSCQTNIDNIYAVGDISSEYQYAYAAVCQAKRVIDFICGRHQPDTFLDFIPQCVFIEPEIAVIGLNEEEAGRRRLDFRAGKYLMKANGRAHAEKKTGGYIKLIISSQDNTILGAELYCENAVELVPLIESFMMNHTDIQTISRMYFPHPSFAEGIRECAGLLESGGEK